MIRAGRMRHRIEIQRKSVVRDAGGGAPASGTTWTTITNGEDWAEVLVVGSQERYVGQQAQTFQIYEIRMRYRNDFTGADRILFEGAVIDITAIKHWGGRKSKTVVDGIERRAA